MVRGTLFRFRVDGVAGGWRRGGIRSFRPRFLSLDEAWRCGPDEADDTRVRRAEFSESRKNGLSERLEQFWSGHWFRVAAVVVRKRQDDYTWRISTEL